MHTAGLFADSVFEDVGSEEVGLWLSFDRELREREDETNVTLGWMKREREECCRFA